MANYIKATDFAVKDSLASGNPLKVIRGSEINTEFNAIQTAVSTKADLNSPAFTGSPTTTTPALATNNTQLANTEFVTSKINATQAAVAITGGTISGTAITGGTVSGLATDLVVADGGTGASTHTANALLLGNGASPFNYLPPSTSGNVVTSDGTQWLSSPSIPSLGVGQTWQNLTGSRALNTTYTNTTGRTIAVGALINGNGALDNQAIISMTVGGVLITYNAVVNRGSPIAAGIMGIVPNGATYSVSGNTSLNTWAELR